MKGEDLSFISKIKKIEMKQHIIIGDNLIGEDILSKYSIDITKLNGAESIRKIMACDIDNY